MKKFIYISGIIIINIFMFGALFKVFHWPGAGVLITSGLVLFCLVFLPLAFYNSYIGQGRWYFSLYLAGFICALIIFTGALFKIQHWPGAGIFLFISIPLPFLYFLPVYIYHFNKSKEKSMLNFLGVMFMMVYVALFTSILSLSTSRNILVALSDSTDDLQRTAALIESKNDVGYKTVEAKLSPEALNVADSLKIKTDEVCAWISSLQVALVKKAEGEATTAVRTDNTIKIRHLMRLDEGHHATLIMRGSDGASGKAPELKQQLESYSNYLNNIVLRDTVVGASINRLLFTGDTPEYRNGEKINLTWESRFFPHGAFLVSVLGNLECVKINLRVAEGVVLGMLWR